MAIRLLIVLRIPVRLSFYAYRTSSELFSGLEHATIRDNIIFGANFGYDEGRYNAIIHACALTRDLEILEAGDMTGSLTEPGHGVTVRC